MLHELARQDPRQLQTLGACPLRDLLIAYEGLLVERVLSQYKHDQILAATAGTKDGRPLPVPPLLKIVMG